MKRINVIGCTGSGKTTFGRMLAERIGYPATDLDDLNWLPGWVQRETPDFRARAGAAAAGDKWVIIGNYSKGRDIVWPRVDTFIWIDLPASRVFWQLLRRSVMRAIDKNPVCNGNIESWKQMFSRDSIIVWFFKSYWKRKREYGAIFDAAGQNPQITYIRLRSHAESAAFIDSLNRQEKAAA